MNIHRSEFLCITRSRVKYSGTRIARFTCMSRVERIEPPSRQPQPDRRYPARRTPGQAEGDERTVDEALRNQEKGRKQRSVDGMPHGAPTIRRLRRYLIPGTA